MPTSTDKTFLLELWLHVEHSWPGSGRSAPCRQRHAQAKEPHSPLRGWHLGPGDRLAGQTTPDEHASGSLFF